MYSLSKSERLCSKKLIDELLISKCSFVKYPFRVLFKESSQPNEFPTRIAISVSKKKFKRAVKRNRVKRLTREAFRLNKTEFYNKMVKGQTVDILFIYLDDNLPTYSKTEKAVTKTKQSLNYTDPCTYIKITLIIRSPEKPKTIRQTNFLLFVVKSVVQYSNVHFP